MRVQLAGMDDIIRKINNRAKRVAHHSERALYRIGGIVKGTAQEYAPISPPGQNRGALQEAIDFKATDSYVDIFVPSNSAAGKYAYKIHEQKGKAWKNRGPGTVAKGSQADHKFITRAIKDNESDIMKILKQELEKAGK